MSSKAKRELYSRPSPLVGLAPPVRGSARFRSFRRCSHRLSAYDATYLALADSRGIGLVTADSDLITLRKPV
jgi:hypothetical protein